MTTYRYDTWQRLADEAAREGRTADVVPLTTLADVSRQCEQRGEPDLTVLVTEAPGAPEATPAEREEVWAFWAK